jgi:hypothetical protein
MRLTPAHVVARTRAVPALTTLIRTGLPAGARWTLDLACRMVELLSDRRAEVGPRSGSLELGRQADQSRFVVVSAD